MNMNPASIVAAIVAPEFFAAILIPVGFFSIPLIAILTRHQRQMAEIIHGRRHEDALRGEVEGLRAEVSELRTQLRALGQGSQVAATAEELKHRIG